jgi:hypothetical protein
MLHASAITGHLQRTVHLAKLVFVLTFIVEGNQQINFNIQKEILFILETVMEQNYFQFDQHYYKQTKGKLWVPSIMIVS